MAKRRKRAQKRKRKGKAPPSRSRRRKSRLKKHTTRKTGKKKLLKRKKSLRPALSDYLRIKKFIWKKHKGEFDSYRDRKFYDAVSYVYTTCKVIGKHCTQKDIEEFYQDWKNQKEAEKKLEPKVPEEVRSFYEIDGLFYEAKETKIILPDYVWVVSPMLFLDKEYAFLPPQYNYEKSFQEWVQWCNYHHSQVPDDFGEDEEDKYKPYWKFSQPYWNPATGRWETEVFSCDADGNKWNWGFEPTGIIEEDGEVVEPPAAPELPFPPEAPKPPALPTPPAPKHDIEEAKRRAEAQRLEIERLKMRFQEKQLGLEQIKTLEESQKRIMADIKDMQAMGAPREVMEALFAEYTATSRKLTELKSKMT